MNTMLRHHLGWQMHESVFLPWLGLMCLGWIMVTSASTEIAEFYTGNAAYFSIRHAVYVLLGIITTYAASQVSLASWAKIDVLMLVVAIIGLVLVFVPGIGHEVNGSQRWLNLGVIKIQASEIAKFAAVFYIAGYLVRRQHEVQQSWSGFIKPLAILAFIVFLLLLEPDFGAVVVLMGAVLIQLFEAIGYVS